MFNITNTKTELNIPVLKIISNTTSLGFQLRMPPKKQCFHKAKSCHSRLKFDYFVFNQVLTITFCFKPHKNNTDYLRVHYTQKTTQKWPNILHPCNSGGWLLPSKAFQIHVSMYKAILPSPWTRMVYFASATTYYIKTKPSISPRPT